MKPTSRLFLIGAIAGSSAVSSCTDIDDHALNVIERDALNSNISCFTATRHKVLTGGGELVITPGTFTTRSGCGGAYLLDLTNYATANNLGTTVVYADAVPTTEPTCTATQVRVYVWENINGTGSFVGSKSRNGTWSLDHRGVGRCRVPHIVVDHEIPGYKANGTRDFRFGMRAQRSISATAIEYRKLAFATVAARPQTPSAIMEGHAAVKQAIDATPAGQIAPTVTALWNRRATFTGDTLCRMTTLDRTLKDFRKPAVVKAGAPQSAVNAQVTAMANGYTAFCTAGGTVANLQAALRSYADATLQIRDGLAVQYATGLSNRDKPATFADVVLNEMDLLAIGKLVKNCGVTPEVVVDFLTAGTLPPGTTADRLFLGTCTGTPSELATAMGLGANFGGQTTAAARTAFKACMAPPKAGTPTDVCNDPRADGSAAEDHIEDAPTKSPIDVICEKLNCTPEERLQLENDELRRQNKLAWETAALPAEDRLAGERGENPAVTRRLQVVRDGDQRSGQEKVDDGLMTLFGQAAEDISETFDDWARLKNYFTGFLDVIQGAIEGGIVPDPFGYIGCDGNGTFRPCQSMCAPDFLTGTWYSSGTFELGRDRKQLNKGNHLDHCLCKMHEAEYGNSVLGGFSISSLCPSDEDREKNECITDPSGPAGGIRPECFKHIFGAADLDAMTARYCAQQTCPALHVSTIEGPGRCGCEPLNVFSGSPPCNAPNVRLCSPDEPEACNNCQSIGTGQVPYASPTCQYDSRLFPGAKDAWALSDTAAMFVTQRDAGVFAAVRPGGTSIVSSTFNPDTFPSIGTAFQQTVATRAVPAVGENIDLQLYFNNLDEDIHHCYVGETRLNNLTPNVPTVVTINLQPNCNGTTPAQMAATRARILSSPFSVEYRLNTNASYKARVEIGKWDFGGALTATPASRLVAPCAPPRPVDPQGGLVETFNPTWLDLPGVLIPRDLRPRPLEVSDGTFAFAPALMFRILR